MKICTITCHRAHNYGATLQCFALQEYLVKTGNDVQVIDYAPGYLKKDKNKIRNMIKRVLLYPERRKGDKTFNSFLDRRINLTSRTYRNKNDLNNYLSDYDVYITGSDQVWNMNMDNGNDDSYFLSFAPTGSVKISYAASIAMDSLSHEQEMRFAKMLNDYKGVSVREQTGVNLLKKIGINCIQVCDPVFLLSQEDWSKFSGYDNFEEEYVLVYSLYRNKELNKYAKELSRKYGCKVYAIGTDTPVGMNDVDRYFWCESPEYFVKLIRNAKCIVTNSFHGMAFSLIYNRPIKVFLPNNGGDSRLKDILHLIDIDIKRNKVIEIDVNDYQRINKKLSALIDRSKDYIRQSIIIE